VRPEFRRKVRTVSTVAAQQQMGGRPRSELICEDPSDQVSKGGVGCVKVLEKKVCLQLRSNEEPVPARVVSWRPGLKHIRKKTKETEFYNLFNKNGKKGKLGTTWGGWNGGGKPWHKKTPVMPGPDQLDRGKKARLRPPWGVDK